MQGFFFFVEFVGRKGHNPYYLNIAQREVCAFALAYERLQIDNNCIDSAILLIVLYITIGNGCPPGLLTDKKL